MPKPRLRRREGESDGGGRGEARSHARAFWRSLAYSAHTRSHTQRCALTHFPPPVGSGVGGRSSSDSGAGSRFELGSACSQRSAHREGRGAKPPCRVLRERSVPAWRTRRSRPPGPRRAARGGRNLSTGGVYEIRHNTGPEQVCLLFSRHFSLQGQDARELEKERKTERELREGGRVEGVRKAARETLACPALCENTRMSVYAQRAPCLTPCLTP